MTQTEILLYAKSSTGGSTKGTVSVFYHTLTVPLCGTLVFTLTLVFVENPLYYLCFCIENRGCCSIHSATAPIFVGSASFAAPDTGSRLIKKAGEIFPGPFTYDRGKL